MTTTPLFATCTYQEFDPSYGIPVKTTVGHPRFRLAYPLEHKLPLVAPDRSFLGSDQTTFRERYRAKLDNAGQLAIRDAARRIQTLAGNLSGDATLVLLCFDKLWQPGMWCHRTMFAEWWSDKTDEEVPEYGRTKQRARREPAMPGKLW